MNLHFPWFHKPTPQPYQPLRAIVATREESRAVTRKRIDVELELAVYAATTTPEQRAAETEAYFRSARLSREMEKGREG